LKNKRKRNIRIKLVLAFFLSVGFAVAGMLVLAGVLVMASFVPGFADFFHTYLWLFAPLLIILFALLIIAFFMMLIQDRVKYLEEITRAVGIIAEGDLSVRIPVRDADELGEMAQAVNDMGHKLETAINEERRMEKAKHDLIVNISHDLRTPLTSVLGYLDLIADMPAKDAANREKYVRIARDKCKSLSELIDGLFEYTKVNDPQMVLHRAPISMGELLEQVVMGFIPELNEKGMEYRLRFTDEKCAVDADAALLIRVFNNIIHNAIVHGGDGRYVDIELRREPRYALVRVINYGRGIPEEQLPYIFEKFYQADRSGAEANTGTGLGLGIAKRIVEMHGGTIGVGSTSVKTVFEVRLPLL